MTNVKIYFQRHLFWLTDLFHGGKIGRIYNEIKYFDTHTPEQCKKKQESALQHILEHAVCHSRYYANRVKPGPTLKLSDFPVIRKQDLIDHYDAFLVDKQFVKGQGDVPLSSRHTSGSSGIPFVMKFSRQKMLQRMCALKYFGAREGFKSHERLLNIHSLQMTEDEFTEADVRVKVKEDKTHNILSVYIMETDKKTLEYIYQLLLTDKSVAMRAHVSTIAALAGHIKENRLPAPPHLKIVSCTGEVLPDHIRQQAKESLHCEVTSMYAMEEFGLLAVEIVPTKASGNLKRLDHADYIFEVLNLDSDIPVPFGQPGRLVITDLRNEAFPIIRYDNGDIVIMQEGTEQSSWWPVLTEIRGRVLDIIKRTNGAGITPNIITKSFQYVNYQGRWQFIQETAKDYRILVDNPTNLKEEELLHYFKSVLGDDANISIVGVDKIPTMPSGKTKLIINKVK